MFLYTAGGRCGRRRKIIAVITLSESGGRLQ